MSGEQLQEQVSQLQAKLQKTEMDFEAYKASAKELEDFLELESSNKEAEIRRMKEDFIHKEKGFKQTKQQLAMLQNDLADAKAQLSKVSEGSSEPDQSREDLKKMEELIVSLQAKNNEAKSQLLGKDKALAEMTEQLEKQKVLWQRKVQALNGQLDSRTLKISELEQQNLKIAKQVKEASSSAEKTKPESGNKQVAAESQSSKKELETLRAQLEKEKERYEDKIRKLQEVHGKAEKQLKGKIHALIEQNEGLQNRTVNVTINSGSPSPMLIKTSLEEDDRSLRPSYHCLLLTKPHYISPFLEIQEEKKTIKIYKSSRTGCFEKSMGGYKHRFDNIAFDHESLIEPIVDRVREHEEPTQHFVLFFGAKKTNKKYLMSKVLLGLRQFLTEKLEKAQDIEATFIKRSQEEEKNLSLSAGEQEGILEIMDKVIALGCKSQRPKSLGGSRRVQSKPKVRYFRIRIDQFSLEIGTSSFTSLSFRDKTSVTTMFNNILYSRLPDVLQSSLSQKYIVLALNPIVDLYEDCKNTLSTTFCKFVQEEPRADNQPCENWRNSPLREELNDMTKKKLEGFQRQSEETSLKVRKLQDECVFFKARFDELQFRLKHLLNTHSAQNTYLKKSPVTLSYQKLLKFVHSVQQRNGSGIYSNLSHGTSMMLKSGIYGDKDLDSLEAL